MEKYGRMKGKIELALAATIGGAMKSVAWFRKPNSAKRRVDLLHFGRGKRQQ